MITANELAGYFAAHAIWSVSEGATLVPMLAYTTESGERKMIRFAHEDLTDAIAAGKQQLEANEVDANDAALFYDGYITLDDERMDAIVIEIRAFFSPDSQAVLAVPYSPVDTGEFRVHKPKLLAWDNCDDFDLDAALQAFFEGVDQHEKGAEIWAQHLDESK